MHQEHLPGISSYTAMRKSGTVSEVSVVTRVDFQISASNSALNPEYGHLSLPKRFKNIQDLYELKYI